MFFLKISVDTIFFVTSDAVKKNYLRLNSKCYILRALATT